MPLSREFISTDTLHAEPERAGASGTLVGIWQVVSPYAIPFTDRLIPGGDVRPPLSLPTARGMVVQRGNLKVLK